MGERMTFQYDNQEYRLAGYAIPQRGQHYLSAHGYIKEHTYPQDMLKCRAIMEPMPVTHTFGNLVFVETGEVRKAREGDWYLGTTSDNRPFPVYRSDRHPKESYRLNKILKPLVVTT